MDSKVSDKSHGCTFRFRSLLILILDLGFSCVTAHIVLLGAPTSSGCVSHTNKYLHSSSHLLAIWSHQLTNLHVFRLWEESGTPGGNPCRHLENMHTPHRNALSQPGPLTPLCCTLTHYQQMTSDTTDHVILWPIVIIIVALKQQFVRVPGHQILSLLQSAQYCQQ